MVTIFGSLRETTIDEEAKSLLNLNLIEDEKILSELKKIFNNQNAVVPIAFDDRDVFKNAPALFDDIFNIMFLRQMMKLSLGFSSLYLSTSYVKEVEEVFKLIHCVAEKFYQHMWMEEPPQMEDRN